MEDPVKALQGLIDNSRNIVFFGGAGVSTESGIPDFRGTGGLYTQRYKYPPEQVVSHTFYTCYPEEFFRFYRDRMLFPDAKPNAAHKKLAELEAAGKLRAVVTQNIDGLHQAAGSKCVFELHGSVLRNYCEKCGKFYGLDFILEGQGGEIPVCPCGGRVKPDVVLYEESLDSGVIEGAVHALSAADLLIIGGTSLAVYPAAGLIQYCRGKVVLINRSATSIDAGADLVITEPIGQTLAQIRA